MQAYITNWRNFHIDMACSNERHLTDTDTLKFRQSKGNMVKFSQHKLLSLKSKQPLWLKNKNQKTLQ